MVANAKPLPPRAENDWWYQYYFCTERGVLGLTEYRYEFGESVWKLNSPTWNFTTSTYEQTAAAFDNPDYVPIVIGNYRWRLSQYPAEVTDRVRDQRRDTVPWNCDPRGVDRPLPASCQACASRYPTIMV